MSDAPSRSRESVTTTLIRRFVHTYLTPAGVVPDSLVHLASRSHVVSVTMRLTDEGNWNWQIVTESSISAADYSGHSIG